MVDDESRDGTLAAARAAAGDDPRVRVLAGGALPRGWVGKSWACWQAVRVARGDWLLFTDADVVHAPDSLGRALAMARAPGPRRPHPLPHDRLRGGARAPGDARGRDRHRHLRRPRPARPIAAQPGGHRRGRLHPGGARRVRGGGRARGHPQPDGGGRVPGRGGQARRPPAGADARRAAGARADVPRRPRGLGRLEQERLLRRGRQRREGPHRRRGRGSPRAAPVGAAIRGARTGDRLLAATGAAGLLAMVALQRLASRSARTPARYAPTLPLGMLVLAGAAARGSLRRLAGRGPEWRGRRYPLAR